MLTFLLKVHSTNRCLFWKMSASEYVFILSLRQITMLFNYVNGTKLLGLDIFLAMVFTEYYVEQFKGLSCCVPLGHPVHPSGLQSVFFSILH